MSGIYPGTSVACEVAHLTKVERDARPTVYLISQQSISGFQDMRSKHTIAMSLCDFPFAVVANEKEPLIDEF